MQTVRDETGRTYLLVKRAAESSRVRDPETGEERYLENETLSVIEGDSPLSTAAQGVPAPVRRAIRAVHDDETLGLLIELVDRGPLAAVELLDAYDMCESDIHGRLAEFRAAGLADTVEV